MTLHVRRHTGEKPYGCDCGERNNIQWFIFGHSDNNFIEILFQGFITNSLLQQHRRASGHIDHHSNNSSIPTSTNSVNNPHRKWNPDDGKRTGITAILSNKLK